VGFHRAYLPYRNTIFLAFIVLEILTGNKKKWYVIFLYVHRKNLVKEKKKIVVYKWVSIAFPVHSPPVLSCSVFQGARTRPCPLVGWHWGLWRNNSKLPYILVQESYAYFFIYSFQYSTFARALSFQKNEIRSLGAFITCEPANVPSVVERGKMIHAPGN